MPITSFPQDNPQHVGHFRDDMVPCPISITNNFHSRERTKLVGIKSDHGRTGWSGQLFFYPAGENRNPLQKFYRRWSGNRQATMSTLHKPLTHIERRGINLVQLQRFNGNHPTHDIHNRIHGTHFMKVDFFHSRIVNGRFDPGNTFKNFLGVFFCSRRQV